ncbi:MAG: hypothetical protein ACFFDF_08030 [Candidatus Odinarchaeota archaeon]
MSETKVQCNRCKNHFRATDSHINLICKGCQNKEKREKQELIEEIEQLKREKKEDREEFLKDWTSLFPVKPIDSPYTHYTVSDIKYISISKKWEAKLNV